MISVARMLPMLHIRLRLFVDRPHLISPGRPTWSHVNPQHNSKERLDRLRRALRGKKSRGQCWFRRWGDTVVARVPHAGVRRPPPRTRRSSSRQSTAASQDWVPSRLVPRRIADLFRRASGVAPAVYQPRPPRHMIAPDRPEPHQSSAHAYYVLRLTLARPEMLPSVRDCFSLRETRHHFRIHPAKAALMDGVRFASAHALHLEPDVHSKPAEPSNGECEDGPAMRGKWVVESCADPYPLGWTATFRRSRTPSRAPRWITPYAKMAIVDYGDVWI